MKMQFKNGRFPVEDGVRFLKFRHEKKSGYFCSASAEGTKTYRFPPTKWTF